MVLATGNTRVGSSVVASFDFTVHHIFPTQILRDAFFKQDPACVPMHGRITKASGTQLTVKWLFRDGRSIVCQHPLEALILTTSPVESVVKGTGLSVVGQHLPGPITPTVSPVEAVVKGAGPHSAVGKKRQHHSAPTKLIHLVYTMSDAKKKQAAEGGKQAPKNARTKCGMCGSTEATLYCKPCSEGKWFGLCGPGAAHDRQCMARHCQEMAPSGHQ